MFSCEFCKKDYEARKAYTGHIIRCPKNPDRIVTKGMTGKTGITDYTKIMSTDAQNNRRKKLKENWLAKYNATPFDKLGCENRRRRVFEEQNYCCNRCGVSEWQGVKLTLELEHKDGNNQNNARDNLEGLCPNCHSITDTWRGRNKPSKNGEVSVTDEALLKCLTESKNIRQGLLAAGLSAKGKNYERAKKLLNK